MTGGTATLGFNNTITTSNNANAIYLPQYSSGLSLQGYPAVAARLRPGVQHPQHPGCKKQYPVTDYQFEQQLNTTLNTVISTYWNLVSSYLAVDVAQQSLDALPEAAG